MCSLHIDGHAHGPGQAATTCQIYMRKFKDGATITIEPWRSEMCIRDRVYKLDDIDFKPTSPAGYGFAVLHDDVEHLVTGIALHRAGGDLLVAVSYTHLM